MSMSFFILGKCRRSGGYTAIELLIVTSIMITISAIVLLGFGVLNDSVALNRSARDLAAPSRPKYGARRHRCLRNRK